MCDRIGLAKSADFAIYASMRGSLVAMIFNSIPAPAQSQRFPTVAVPSHLFYSCSYVDAIVQGSVLCHTRKVLHDVAGFYTLGMLGGGRFFQRDSPSPPPRRLHRAFL